MDYDDPEFKPEKSDGLQPYLNTGIAQAIADHFGEISESVIDFNSTVWNAKKEKGLSLKDSIKIEIPKELDIFKKDLVAMHNLG